MTRTDLLYHVARCMFLTVLKEALNEDRQAAYFAGKLSVYEKMLDLTTCTKKDVTVLSRAYNELSKSYDYPEGTVPQSFEDASANVHSQYFILE